MNYRAAARTCWLAAIITSIATPHQASTQPAYPSRPLTLILPLAAGSAGDVALRLVGQKMAENMHQGIVVENMTGASGLVGTERLVRARADGYFIGGIGDSVLNYAVNLAPKETFNPMSDLEPVALIATIPWTLAVNPHFGTKTLGEFFARARASPGQVDYASTGLGSASHVGMEMLAAQAKISLHHVPYRGATTGVNDVVGGQVPAVFSAVSVVLPFIKSGKLVALGVPLKERSALLPDVPTFEEAGMSDFTFTTWVALFAPKGTPRAVVARLNAETAKALADPTLQNRLLALGLEPRTASPEELGSLLASGHSRVAAIIKQVNIKIE